MVKLLKYTWFSKLESILRSLLLKDEIKPVYVKFQKLKCPYLCTYMLSHFRIY